MIPATDDPWVESSRYVNAIAEERGLEATCEQIGVDLQTLIHVSEQRALRSVLLIAGRGDELRAMDGKDRAQPVALDAQDRAALILFQAAVMDALVIGYHARVLEERAN